MPRWHTQGTCYGCVFPTLLWGPWSLPLYLVTTAELMLKGSQKVTCTEELLATERWTLVGASGTPGDRDRKDHYSKDGHSEPHGVPPGPPPMPRDTFLEHSPPVHPYSKTGYRVQGSSNGCWCNPVPGPCTALLLPLRWGLPPRSPKPSCWHSRACSNPAFMRL